MHSVAEHRSSAAPALVDTYTQFPFTLARGEGSRVWDMDGRAYWDLYGGHAVALLGHGHSGVSAAIAAQARSLLFYSNAAPLAVRTSAAERLAAFAPAGLNRVFFCNSGAEANENALRIAIQQTGRKRIAALHGAFHGRTLLPLAATPSAKLHAGLDGLLCPTLHLPPNDSDGLANIDESIAAVIVEPIQSMAGVVELTVAYRQALRQRCDDVGAKLIFDEVQTGVGRLGRPFAAGEGEVTPDFVTLAKGIANGVPMGAVLMTSAVADRLHPGDLGTTFGGGPLACAALLAVLSALEHEDVIAHAERLGQFAHQHLRVGPVQQVLGRGCLLGLKLNRPAKAVQDALLKKGFIMGTSADPHVLRLLPPLNTPEIAMHDLAGELQELEVVG